MATPPLLPRGRHATLGPGFGVRSGGAEGQRSASVSGGTFDELFHVGGIRQRVCGTDRSVAQARQDTALAASAHSERHSLRWDPGRVDSEKALPGGQVDHIGLCVHRLN